MNRKIFVLVLFFLFLASAVQAADWYVNVNTGDNADTGTQEANAWKNISYAATQSAASDTIYVAAGTYNNAAGEGTQILLGTDRHYIGAGYLVTTVESFFKPDNNTTVEGFAAFGTIDIVGDNVHIEDCYAEGSPQAIDFNFNNSGRVISCEVVATGNYGIYLQFPYDVTIEGTTISGADVNGIFLDGAYLNFIYHFKNNIIRDNGTIGQASEGGIRIVSGTVPLVTIEGNSFIRNNQYAVRVEEGIITLVNNVICSGSAPNDLASSYSKPFYVDTGATVNYSYNDIWNLRYDTPDGSGTITDQGNNISVCPEFVDPWNDDYDLYVGSPLIGTGQGGANIGAYTGTGIADNPYKSTSYVNISTGSDEATALRGTSEAYPWKTIGYANKYSTGKINVAAGLYNTAAGDTLSLVLTTDQWLEGAGRDTTTIEGKSLILYFDSTLEAVTFKDEQISIYNQRNMIRDCLISREGSGYGISFKGSAFDYGGAKVFSTEVTGCDTGISLSAHLNTSIEGCVIHNNNNYGIYKNATGTIGIRGNEIRDNGEGVQLYNGLNYLENNTIIRNLRGIDQGTGSLYSKNNIICNRPDGSTPEAGSRGIYGGGTMRSSYDNCWNNDYNWTGSNLTGAGTISVNPQFVDEASDDFNLAYNSPCIDSGDPASGSDPDGSRRDMGAYPFNLQVTSTTAVYVSEPNGGETLAGNGTYEVTWSATAEIGGSISKIEIRYSTDEGVDGFINLVTDNTDNDGSFIWDVPDISISEGRISVAAFGSVTATDESDSDFSIADSATPPNVTISAPDGGEVWGGGASHNVTFTATDVSGIKANSLNLYYSTDGGATYPNTIATGQPVSSPYSWTLPTGVNTTQARVRITVADVNDNVGTDESNANFTIDSDAPEVIVQAPTAGETLTGESTYTIRYTVTDAIGLAADPIDLFYTTGSSWIAIASDESNSGTYSWTVPNIDASSVRVIVQAEDTYGHLGWAASSIFSLEKRVIPDTNGPSILIQLSGITIKDDDPISSRPKIKAVITDEESNPEDGRIYIDNVAVNSSDVIRDFPASGNGQVMYLSTVSSALATGEHSIKVEGWDYAGNINTREVTGLKVAAAAEAAALTTNPIVSSAIFAPDGSATVTIAFTLNKDAATQIIMFGASGEQVWNRKFSSGELGAQAGYNTVAFNGISDLSGAPLGNGIYIYKIVAEGRAIGKGHIVIYQ